MGARPIHETILIAKQTGDRLRDNKKLRHLALASFLYKSGQLTYKRKLFFHWMVNYWATHFKIYS